MYRPASRTILRVASSLRPAGATPTSRLGARFLNTAPPHKTSRGWKNAALRWGLAGGIVYWYNTTNVFAEGPTNLSQPPETHYDPEPLPTIDSLAAQRKQREAAKAVDTHIEDAPTSSGPLGEGGVAPGSPEALEAEAGQQGAFNEETGEINWDCPCLGGMADGPCGENFKEAFSCFVFSKEEPKGVDCIEKFKNMQDCFRQHPDIYGAELEDDEDDYEGEEGGLKTPVDSSPDAAAPATSTPASSPLPAPIYDSEETPAPASKREEPEPTTKKEKAKAATKQVKKEHEPLSESEELVPRAAHDAR